MIRRRLPLHLLGEQMGEQTAIQYTGDPRGSKRHTCLFSMVLASGMRRGVAHQVGIEGPIRP